VRQKLIEQYFQSMLDLLAELPFVESSNVNLEKRGDLAGFIRGEVEFRDGSSLLFFRELIDLRPPLQKTMYAYHYQKRDGALIFRYDNTAHHKLIPTFPHHKHLHDGDVASSELPSLEHVLREIEDYLSQNNEGNI
jgi:hypothetical protein